MQKVEREEDVDEQEVEIQDENKWWLKDRERFGKTSARRSLLT